jgi:hypothetical protein
MELAWRQAVQHSELRSREPHRLLAVQQLTAQRVELESAETKYRVHRAGHTEPLRRVDYQGVMGCLRCASKIF